MTSEPGQPAERGGRSGPAPRAGRPGGSGGRPAAIAAYLLLFAFGLLQALIGAFQYSRGPVPLAAVCFAAGILVTCVLGAWGMRTPAGGLMPGVGWFATTFILATATQGGSVVITNTTAGKWFLFGGAGCAAVGCLVSFLGFSRAGRR